MSSDLPPRPVSLFHKVTLDEQIAEIEYELRQRFRVYERLIANGKMTRRNADAHNIALWGVYDNLIWLRKNRAAVIDAHKHIESLKKEAPVQAVLDEFPGASVDRVNDLPHEDTHDRDDDSRADAASDYVCSPETERALALNSAMFALCMEREGIATIRQDQITLLKGASLIELANASRLVKEDEDKRPAYADGSRSFSMVCDDRIVAAIYAFLHFTLPPASSPLDDDYPLVVLRDTEYTYFLISGARERKEDDEGEEE